MNDGGHFARPSQRLTAPCQVIPGVVLSSFFWSRRKTCLVQVKHRRVLLRGFFRHTFRGVQRVQCNARGMPWPGMLLVNSV